MRKLIACMNMTLDGYCDHTAMTANEETHQHYTDLLNNAGAIIYGNVTYGMMESYWPEIIKNPSGKKSMDDFAKAIDQVPKIVYSRTRKTVSWNNSTIKNEIEPGEINAMKAKPGKDLFVGSPGMIVAFTQLNLIDEYQICIHPVIAGSGLILFRDISNKIELKLTITKTFGSGAVLHYYEKS